MRSPWVSREMHNESISVITAAHERAVASLMKINADLLAALRELRTSGANPKDADPVLPPRKVDPIQTAINRVTAGKDEKVRVAAWRQVDIDRKAGLKEDEIVARIHRGSRPAEDVQ